MFNTREQRYMRNSYEDICYFSRKFKEMRYFDSKDQEDANRLCVLIDNACYYYQQSDIASYTATLSNYIQIARNSSNPFIKFTATVEYASIALYFGLKKINVSSLYIR